tara:strand:- start:3651 stop:5870 length:2220 start_codon:yes stop_codon:yes gene_type:complete
MCDREKELLAAALEYASNGWSVLPLHSVTDDRSCTCGSNACKSPGKHPRTSNGVKDATTNAALIRSWWSANPKANVGIALGEASGLWCVDVDPRNGGDDSLLALQLKNDDIPETLHCLTGGGGEHFFFEYKKSDRIRNGKLAEGIDVKSTGGYVVAAPSRHASGELYKWAADSSKPCRAPGWILEELRSGSSGSFDELFSGAEEGREPLAGILDPRKVDELRSALRVIDADDRDLWVSVGMALNSTRAGSQAFALWSEWSSTSPKYDERDAMRVWNSFDPEPGGVSVATIFGLAKVNGWTEPMRVVEATDAVKKVVRVDTPPIPEDVLRPPGILADVADYMTRTAIRPQPLFSLVGALSLCANVIGRKYESESGLRSNLYLVAIGSTGCGKNHARSCIKRILTAADLVDNMGGEELASGQGILARAAETPNVLFQLDEFGLLMKSVQNPNAGSHLAAILSILMKLFSSASDVYVGTEYANLTKRPRVTIEYPCVGIHATTTGGTFYESLDSKHVLSGYLNRLIVLESHLDRPKRQRRRASRDIPHAILEWCATAANPSGSGSGRGNLSGVNPATPLMVVKTEDASRMFDEYDERIDLEMSRTRGTGLDSLYNRAWEHADKVALVAAVADNPTEPVVRVEHARFAISLVNWSVECLVEQVRSRVADSPFESRVKECLRAVTKSGDRGMTEREMGRHGAFSKLTPKERLEALTALTESEHVERVQFKTAGRPRVAYVALDS